MRRKFVLSLLPALMSFGPLFMVLFLNTEGGIVKWMSVLGAFMVTFALFLLDGLIRETQRAMVAQAALLEELRKAAGVSQPAQ